MFCKKCGNEINQDDSFCPKCGTKLGLKENEDKKDVKEISIKYERNKKIYIIVLAIIAIIIGGIIFYINEKSNQNKYSNKFDNNKYNESYNDNNIDGSISETVQNSNIFKIVNYNCEYDESNKTVRIYGIVKNIGSTRFEVAVLCNIYNEVYTSVTKSSPNYLLDVGEQCDYEIIYTYTDYKPIKYQISSFNYVYRTDYTKENKLSNQIFNNSRFKITSYNWDNDTNNRNLRIYGKIKNITSETYQIRVWARIFDKENVIKENLISDTYILDAGEESEFEILFDYKNYGSTPLNYQILSIEYYLK